ncbi:MAG: hypothetical protein J6P69_09225 [Bacteroidales bacterium]|nr:hypothetical protein [Bacteroidales bacterium]
MNAASIVILAIVVALVAIALYFVLRKDGNTCSCCEQKEGCPYSGGGKCNCDNR